MGGARRAEVPIGEWYNVLEEFYDSNLITWGGEKFLFPNTIYEWVILR